ncbi:MAG: four helix bundle protein [Anaerolineae bacterium]|nr:four helix bundle protein [Anaerolineae bacterium]
MHKFEKLEVWQLAIEYTDLCYTIADKLPEYEKYNLASQLRRAAVSIGLNIAEGSTGQTNPEQARFLGMAVRSLIETVACQRLIERRNYLDDPTLPQTVYQAGEKLSAKLQAMRRAILGETRLREEGAEYLYNERPTTKDEGWQTNDERPMTDDEGRGTRNEGPTTKDEGPMTDDEGQKNNVGRSSVVVGLSEQYYAHPSAYLDEPCEIGAGTKIWHFCHVMAHSKIGERCILGQNVLVANNVVIGNNVKIQNNVSVYTGVELEDDVFCGPSCVFTNVINPRSQIKRHSQYQTTLVRRGVTIGANATIVCGATIGRYAFIGAGAVVRGDAPDYALMLGVPARQKGWMSRHGHRLTDQNADGHFVCPESGWRYREVEPGVLRCLDWPEDDPLPVKNED